MNACGNVRQRAGVADDVAARRFCEADNACKGLRAEQCDAPNPGRASVLGAELSSGRPMRKGAACLPTPSVAGAMDQT
jgi:hypothetical protein